MANTIRIKRRPSSGSAGSPSAASLYNGELAFNENDNTLYYAYGSGVNGISQSVPAIAGSGAYALRGGTNATGTWPIGITGNSATVTNGVYTTGDQTIEGTKIFYGSGTNGSAVAIKSETNYPASLSFMEGSNIPKMSFIWDGVNKLKLITGSAPATAFTFQVNTHLEVRATGTSSSATNIPVFISNPNSSAQTIYTRTPSELKSDIGLSNVTNDIQIKQTTGGTTVGYIPTWNSTSGELLAAGYAVSTNLITNSGSTHIPRADSVVNYVSSGLSNHIHGNITNDGKIGSTSNLPLITTTNGTITTGSFGSTANTFCQGNDTRLSDTRNTTNSLTVNNGGAGDSSSFTFNGSAAKTISYNSIGAPSQTGALASGTNWNISILGNSATVTNGVYTTGNQTISGQKTFSGTGIFDGSFKAAYGGSAYNIIFSPTQIQIGQGEIDVRLAGNSYYDPNGVYDSTKEIANKAYVNSMVGSGIATNDAMIFKGAIDCSTSPNYPAADRGWTYKVSVAGKIGGASGPTVEVNDTLICSTDGTVSGTHAAVGSNWVILQTNIADSSILVTGPTSATSGNFPIFDGTTGKIISNSSYNYNSFLAYNDSTVVKTTGNQSISGIKTFTDYSIFNSGIELYANSVSQCDYIAVWNGLADPSAGPQTLSNISVEQFLTDLNLNNVDNTSLSTWSGSAYITTLGTIATGVWQATTIAVDKGGTGQTSYVNGELLIGNSTGNTLTKATLTQGTGIAITNGTGSISVAHASTSSLSGAQGSNGIASITVDGLGHVTAVTSATYLTAGTVCAAIVDCSLDGGTF